MHSSNSHERFSALLAEWRVAPPADPAFRAAVWARLERRTPASFTAYLRAHLIGWSLACGLALLVSGWTGHRAAQARLEAQREQMVVSYLGNLDPRVMARMPGAPR